MVYSANLVKASLMVPESRIVAGLLLSKVSDQQWRQAILVDNVLQKRSLDSAKTFADYIRRRLLTMPPELWSLVSSGSVDVATQATFAATIKHSKVMADFMDIIVRDRVLRMRRALSDDDWREFMDGCIARDPHVEKWTLTSVKKVRQVAFRILAEAGYVTDTKTLVLQRIEICHELMECLKQHKDLDIIHCMEATR